MKISLPLSRDGGTVGVLLLTSEVGGGRERGGKMLTDSV